VTRGGGGAAAVGTDGGAAALRRGGLASRRCGAAALRRGGGEACLATAVERPTGCSYRLCRQRGCADCSVTVCARGRARQVEPAFEGAEGARASSSSRAILERAPGLLAKPSLLRGRCANRGSKLRARVRAPLVEAALERAPACSPLRGGEAAALARRELAPRFGLGDHHRVALDEPELARLARWPCRGPAAPAAESPRPRPCGSRRP
jgi:hypothetical protein